MFQKSRRIFINKMHIDKPLKKEKAPCCQSAFQITYLKSNHISYQEISSSDSISVSFSSTSSVADSDDDVSVVSDDVSVSGST